MVAGDAVGEVEEATEAVAEEEGEEEEVEAVEEAQEAHQPLTQATPAKATLQPNGQLLHQKRWLRSELRGKPQLADLAQQAQFLLLQPLLPIHQPTPLQEALGMVLAYQGGAELSAQYGPQQSLT